MKKKVKLFTTIASLCLAVALMAFGVYAATQVTFGVSGTIQFNATALTGTWEYEIVKGTNVVAGVTKTSGDFTTDQTGVELAITNGQNTATFTVKAYFTPTSDVASGEVTASGSNTTFGKNNKSKVEYTFTESTDKGTWSGSTAAEPVESSAASILVTITVDPEDQGSNHAIAWAVMFGATAGNAA